VAADESGALGALDAEDGTDMLVVYPPFFKGSWWSHLPESYGDMAFMDY
jgi:hypothetical protein